MRRFLGTILAVSVLALVLPGPPPSPAEEVRKLTCGDWLNWGETDRLIYVVGLVDGALTYLSLKSSQAQTEEEKAAWLAVGFFIAPIDVQATLMKRCVVGRGELLSIQALLAFVIVAEEKKSHYLSGKRK